MRGGQKRQIVDEIAAMLGVEPPPMSTGSTEPKTILLLVNRELALGLPPSLGKPDLARAIVEAAGYEWAPDCESRGATVTTEGLLRVLKAVRFLVGR